MDPESLRQQILQSPALLIQLQTTQPELAEAAVNDPPKFVRLVQQMNMQLSGMQMANTRLLHADPFDVDVQREIEEIINQEAVVNNLHQAIEHIPESFGRVVMLYINIKVNGHDLKAFVDSGAQATIKKCGIMRLVDKRFQGLAKGVGTAKIVGRVHSAPISIGDQHLPCSFTIMDDKNIDLLFGLDLLRRHQAIIDLKKNELRIAGVAVPFLSESELPGNAKELFKSPHDTEISQNTTSNQANSSTNVPKEFTEADVQGLMELGCSKEVAKKLLTASQGNADMAANLLFNDFNQ